MPVSNWLIYGNTIIDKLDEKSKIFNEYKSTRFAQYQFVLDTFEFNRIGFMIALSNEAEILIYSLVPKEYYNNYNYLSKVEEATLYFSKENNISYSNTKKDEIEYLNDIFNRLLDKRDWSIVTNDQEPIVLGWFLSDIYYSPTLLNHLVRLVEGSNNDFHIDENYLRERIEKGEEYLNNNNLTNKPFLDFGYLNKLIIKIGLGLRGLKYDRFTGHSRLFNVEDPLIEINPAYSAFRVIRSISNRINSIDKNPEKMELLEKLKSKNPEIDLILNKDNDTLKQYLNLNFAEENILKLESRIIEIQGL